jgi:hypothetical protein
MTKVFKENELPFTFDAPIIQGDVVLKRLSTLPEGAKLLNENVKILQASEVTHHNHHFRDNASVSLYNIQLVYDGQTDANTITPNENKVIVVHEPSVLYHGKQFSEEPYKDGSGDHNCFSVPAGVYYIDIVRTYDYNKNEESRVVD